MITSQLKTIAAAINGVNFRTTLIADAQAFESEVNRIGAIADLLNLTLSPAALTTILANINAQLVAAQNAQAAAAASAANALSSWTAAQAAAPSLNPPVVMNPSTISADLVIPSGYNAQSAGPSITISAGTTVTIQENANWTIS